MNLSWPNLLTDPNVSDCTTLSSFTSEASLLAGPNLQPFLKAFYFAGAKARGRKVRFTARGVLSSTGTPTYLFKARLGTTAGDSYLAGTVIGTTAALTTGSGVSNEQWELLLDVTCRTPGIGTGAATLCVSGWLSSPGLAAPYRYAVQPSTPPQATWTVTIDAGLTQYLNLTATCSASNASNAITCKEWEFLGLN